MSWLSADPESSELVIDISGSVGAFHLSTFH